MFVVPTEQSSRLGQDGYYITRESVIEGAEDGDRGASLMGITNTTIDFVHVLYTQS